MVSIFICWLALYSCASGEKQYITMDGFAEGTTYHMIYHDEKVRDLKPQVEKLLAGFELSLSAYNPQSIISKVNRNEKVLLDDYFITVFNTAREMYNVSDGAFNIAASPLFNAWGFGFKNNKMPTAQEVDSLQEFIDMKKVRIDNRRIVKDDPRITLNANAIAKGYSSDVVAAFFERMGIADYMVEIGGEIRCKGKNRKGERWAVAIDKPVDGNYTSGENIQGILRITDCALATSGNYRRFYVVDGKKYAHTIDPRTGYPVTHNLLSATIIANDCMHADAYATVLLVLGLEESKKFLEKHPELKALLIYDDHGEMKTWYTSNLLSNMK